MLDDERMLVAGKRGARRLGFALLLKFYTRHGRFPAAGADLPGAVVEFVARQVQVAAAEFGSYEWAGRSIEHHRAQIREHLGFRECTVADAEQLMAWLAEHVTQIERRPERVREEVLARCRSERIEPPTTGRIDRVVRSALRTGEDALTTRVSGRLSADAKLRIGALVAVDDDVDSTEPDIDQHERAALAQIKEAPGKVSLETMLTEIQKVLAVRAIGVGSAALADVAPQVVAGWRARAAVESPSHLRTHPEALRLTLLAALLREREREMGPIPGGRSCATLTLGPAEEPASEVAVVHQRATTCKRAEAVARRLEIAPQSRPGRARSRGFACVRFPDSSTGGGVATIDYNAGTWHCRRAKALVLVTLY